jgi:hypothetical protein
MDIHIHRRRRCFGCCRINSENIRIFPRHLKKIPYICFMVINTFTYYEHFKEINKFLMYASFVDGEIYKIEVLDGKKYICGNFVINYITSGTYQDRTVSEGFPVTDKELRMISKIVQPLEFKKISK